MNQHRTRLGIVLAAGLTCAAASAQTITAVPPLPAGPAYESHGYAVSADGLVVVGKYSGGGQLDHAFRWVVGGAWEDLGNFAGGFWSEAWAVTPDGAIVGGQASQLISGQQYLRSFRRIQGFGLEDLGNLCNCALALSQVRAFSANGAVAAGYSAAPGFSAYRWTSAGMVSLGLAGGYESFGMGITADGATVIGFTSNQDGTASAVRWPSGGGHQFLPIPFPYTSARAFAVSPDGSVIVGDSIIPSVEQHATRWVNDSPQVLGKLYGEVNATALSVNNTGDFVVGETSYFGPDNGAWAWTVNRPVTRLGPLLAAGGVDLTGWSSIDRCTDISDDGRTLVGTGTYLGGERAFVVRNFNGICGPWILDQPQSTATCLGGEAAFFATAYGPTLALPTFTWHRIVNETLVQVFDGTSGSGTVIGGATTPQLTFSSCAADAAGEYFCMISAGCDTIFSVTVTLSVNTNLPSIVFQPVDADACDDDSASYTTTIFGSSNDAPFAHQWQREATPNNFVNLFNGPTGVWDGGGSGMGGIVSGAITQTLTIAADTANNLKLTAVAHGIRYRCIVSNACGSVDSAAVNLKIWESCQKADMNGDDVVDFFDIDPFLLALFDPLAYAAQYPNVHPDNGDINDDNVLDFFDIDPFLICLFAVCP